MTVELGATDLVTTEPAPMIEFLPIVNPGRITTFDPILAPSSTIVVSRTHEPVSTMVPSAFVALGLRSFVNITPCPTNTPFPILTPSQINECDWILQCVPT